MRRLTMTWWAIFARRYLDEISGGDPTAAAAAAAAAAAVVAVVKSGSLLTS